MTSDSVKSLRKDRGGMTGASAVLAGLMQAYRLGVQTTLGCTWLQMECRRAVRRLSTSGGADGFQSYLALMIHECGGIGLSPFVKRGPWFPECTKNASGITLCSRDPASGR